MSREGLPSAARPLVIALSLLSALAAVIGAVLAGLPLFWTLPAPVAVAAVIACSIALAQRAAVPA
jgi:hypothetical protein